MYKAWFFIIGTRIPSPDKEHLPRPSPMGTRMCVSERMKTLLSMCKPHMLNPESGLRSWSEASPKAWTLVAGVLYSRLVNEM